jgi:5-(carboxyamino)imidazole ribonucleotide synthase
LIRPGATIGILGGGQLGRMLALAAAPYGLRTHVFTPEADSPAFAVATHRTCAAYDDEAALVAFAKTCDVVTYEFENVPRRTAEVVGSLAPLFPDADALATTQDRLTEKTFVTSLGIATAPFRAVASLGDLGRAVAEIGRPAVLKTRRFGYDGKGQALLGPDSELEEAWAAMHQAPCIVEGFVPFDKEISVVAARTAAGEFAAYDVCANTHRHHILDVTRVPAGIGPAAEDEALAVTRRIADALDYVGVLTVEMFLVKGQGGERVVVNEIAPRVHNSGHWTIEGAVTSQFAQHVRAICGWPLGSARRLGQILMRNLIGDDVDGWDAILQDPEAHLHVYGKTGAHPGRKMGHVTRVRASPELQ